MDETTKKITGTKEFENTFDEVIAKETKASAEFMNKLIEQLLSNDTYLKALTEQILTTLDNKAAANHNHNYNDLNNKPSLGSAATKSATDSVTNGSSSLITSGAVYTALANKAATNHNHNYNDLNNKPSLGSAATKSSTDSVASGSSALITSGAVYNALNDKAPKNSPTFTGTPKTTPNTNYTTSQLRNIRFGTSVPSSLENGEIFFVY